MSSDIVLSEAERKAITGYENGTKQLKVLHGRGFLRAYINRSGEVVLERTHYEAVTRGEAVRQAAPSLERPDAAPAIHWRDRPEHQERLRLEREAFRMSKAKESEDDRLAAELWATVKAELDRTRPERRAALSRHHTAKRKAASLQRTPKWADLEAIKEFHRRAQALAIATGTQHHVDHVIPLQGKLVSGLHVAENLQILTGAENIRKRNRYEV